MIGSAFWRGGGGGGDPTVKALISPRGLIKFQTLWRGDLLERGIFKILWQRQNCTTSKEFEMLRIFTNNYELLRYTTNTIKNWKLKKILTQYAFCFNTYSFFVEGRRGEGGLLERGDLLERGAY